MDYVAVEFGKDKGNAVRVKRVVYSQCGKKTLKDIKVKLNFSLLKLMFETMLSSYSSIETNSLTMRLNCERIEKLERILQGIHNKLLSVQNPSNFAYVQVLYHELGKFLVENYVEIE